MIIVLVQYIVITKGAERVSEVAARFTLDAMPGKQMAIDADLSSGLITEDDARERRYKIQKEADFYGAMDGATKIVKGDAIVAIITVLINFIGGIIIGIVMSDMSFGEVLQIYSIATVGDGLACQLPALMISTATGMVVTRAVSDGSLNVDVKSQFMAQPTVLMLSGGIILFMVVIPGGPKVQPVVLGLLLLFAGYRLKRTEKKKKIEEQIQEQVEAYVPEEFDENAYFKDINNIYSLLTIEPIEMEFGYSLIPLVDENSGGNLINRIIIFRRQYAQEMGFVIPSVRLRDSASLNANQYLIKMKGESIAKGEVLTDYYLALEPGGNLTGEVDGIETIEPAYGIPSKWITPDKKALAEIYGYTAIDPLSVMLTHLTETIKRNLHELLTRAEVTQLIENVRKTSPELIEEAIPGIISPGNLQKILYSLLKEGVPIRDMSTIIETIVDSALISKDMDVITENVRIALKRTITRKFNENGQIKVVTLDAEVEKAILAGLTRSEQGVYLALNPDLIQRMIEQLKDQLAKFTNFSQQPVILTSHVIRVYFYRLIEQFYPNVTVLSFSEISNDVQIQAIGNIQM